MSAKQVLKNHYWVYLCLLCLSLGITSQAWAQQKGSNFTAGTTSPGNRSLTKLSTHDLLRPGKDAAQEAQVAAISNKVLSKFQVLKLDKGIFKQLMETRPGVLHIMLPSQWGDLILELNASPQQSPELDAVTANGKQRVNYQPGLHYAGIIKGKKGGRMAMSFFPNGDVMGVGWSLESGGNLVVGRVKQDVPMMQRPLIVYDDADLLVRNPFTCHTDDHAHTPKVPDIQQKSKGGNNSSAQPLNTCKGVTNYWEAGTSLYNALGSDLTATGNYMTGLFNLTNTLYNVERTHNKLTRVQVNTLPDNVPLNSSFAALDTFSTRQGRNNPSEELSHYFAGISALGGVAYVGVICLGFPQFQTAVSDVDPFFNALPMYSWSVSVTAHEMGHNFGSRHTQWCGWDKGNGVIGNIDSCVATESFSGSTACYTGPNVPRVGTIMSYCHLTGSIDLALGFGPLPGNVLRNTFDNAFCLSGSPTPNLAIAGPGRVCPGETVNLSVTSIPNATYLWSGPNGFAATGATASVPTFGTVNAGSYSVQVTVDGCTFFALPKAVTIGCASFTAPVSSIGVCPGEAVRINSTVGLTPNANTRLRLELSNATGSFTTSTLIAEVTNVSALDTALNTTSLAAGSYRVRLITNHNGGTSIESLPYTIAVGSRTATVTTPPGVALCSGQQTTLVAPNNGFANRWTSKQGNTIGTGTSLNIGPVTTSDTVYLSQTETRSGRLGMLNPSSGGFRQSGSEVFNWLRVYRPIVLNSVVVETFNSGTVVLNIIDSASRSIVATVSRTVGAGRQTLSNLNLSIPAGTYGMTNTGSTMTMYRELSLPGYPFRLTGIAEIFGANVGTDFRDDVYYWFYDLNITSDFCPSTPTPFAWNVNSVPQPTITTTGSTFLCPGDSLVLSASNSTGYRWSTGATTSQITVRTAGTYWVQAVGSTGCESVRSDSVTVTTAGTGTPPVVTIVGDTIGCDGDSVVLTAPLATRYRWSNGDTTQSITVRQSGFYTVQISSGTCFSASSAPVNVSIDARPARPTVDYRGPTTICQGDSAVLQAIQIGTSTLRWNTGDRGENLVVKQSGTYWATSTDRRCPSENSDSITIVVVPIPAAPRLTASGPTTFCPGDSVILSTTAAGPYLWTTGDTTQSIVVRTPGTYNVSVSSGNGLCLVPGINPVTVISSRPGRPQITALGSTTFCAGDSVTLEAPASTGYFWSNFASTRRITVRQAGTYWLSVSNALGCFSVRDSIVVTVNQLPAPPNIGFSGPPSFCQGDSVRLTADSSASYLWSNGATTRSILVRNSGTFTVRAISSEGCNSLPSLPAVVTVTPEPGQPTITASGALSFCAGDSVTLTSSIGTAYLWNTGATTRSIIARTTGFYAVQVFEGGCISAASDVEQVRAITLPPIPTIVRRGDTLSISGLAGYDLQWTLDGQPITGATDSSWVAILNGDYRVRVGFAGCQNLSAPISVITALPSAQLGHFSVSPNPTSGAISIQFGANSPTSLSLVNVLGQVVMTQELGTQQSQQTTLLDLKALPAGVYWLVAPGYAKTKVVRQ